MIRLYHVPLSPFCRKVRLVLAEKKIEVELVEERYWEQSPDFLRRNPAGKVPVLKMNGLTLSEGDRDLIRSLIVAEPSLVLDDVDVSGHTRDGIVVSGDGGGAVIRCGSNGGGGITQPRRVEQVHVGLLVGQWGWGRRR
mgnify:CR=1 FL=1